MTDLDATTEPSADPPAEPTAGRPAASGASRLDSFADAMASVLEKCVWSQTMTHETLVPYLIEETYELVDAIEAGTTDDIIEELGDVLWQVAFHSEIASRAAAASGDSARFDIEDVAERVTAKMVRRHPHVFGDEVAETPEDVLRLWTAAKAAEKTQRRSVLDGIPQGMPALALADKVIGRAARVGVQPPEHAQRPVQVPERAQRVEGSQPNEVDVSHSDAVFTFADEDELGAQLLTLVAAARARGIDAERSLRQAVRELQSEIRAAEGAAQDRSASGH